MISTGLLPVLITTFLASAVEATEMVTIVVGVGATRGWRSTVIGVASGFGVLAVTVVILGAALSAIPIGPLRLVIGALLLVFGLQWFRKGVMRVAARGLAGIGGSDPQGDADQWRGVGMDWTALFLAFKGVVLEGLEVAIIVVSFGAGANQLGGAVIGGVGAIILVGDDWTMAAAVAIGLMLTAVLNVNHIVAWWLIPLIVVSMLGISLRRASRKAQ